MKKALTLTLVLVMIISAMSVAVSAQGYDAPTTGGKTIFLVEDMMYEGDPGTQGHGAIIKPTMTALKSGKPLTYAGLDIVQDKYKGLDCVKVTPIDGKVTGYFDFNYYQWDSEFYMPSLDCSQYKWLKIKYAYNEKAKMDYMMFFASKDVTPLGVNDLLTNGYTTWDIANGNGEWMETIVNLDDIIFEDGTTWSESTVRQFRIHLFEGNDDPDAVCYIAGFGFVKTEEEAKAWDYTAAGTTDTSAADKAAAEKAAAEKAAAEKAAAEKAAAEKAAAEKAAAEKAAAEAAAKAAEAAKKAEEAAAAAAAEDASEEVKAAAEAAKAEAEAAAAAAKAAEDTANAAASAAQTQSAAQTSDYTVVAVIAAVAALAAFAVAKKKFNA